MVRVNPWLRVSAVILLFGVAVATQAQAQRTIFLVRHAEKVSNAPDAVLNDAGHARAECLASTLADAGIQAIYVTDVRRVQQTAEPLAARLKLTPIVTPKADLAGLVAKLRSGDAMQVLVVGHQDTVPKTIAALGAGNVQPIADSQFDILFVVTLEGREARLTKLHYCDCGQPAQPNQGMKPDQ